MSEGARATRNPDSSITVKESMTKSTEAWIRDLLALFENAQELYPDMMWRMQGEHDSVVWGHKALVYARASKDFRNTYLCNHFSDAVLHVSRHDTTSSPLHTGNPIIGAGGGSHRARMNEAPVQSVVSTHKDRTPLNLRSLMFYVAPSGTVDLLRALLKSMYTSEGIEVIFNWARARTHIDNPQQGFWSDPGGPEILSDCRGKLSQDLTYMWRSKLFADVHIHLSNQVADEDSLDGLNATADPSRQTMVFTSHKFILASRSNYFSTIFKQRSHQQRSVVEVYLSSPPVTATALYFCLGYIYAGNLHFSNRTFDFATALRIYSTARFLKIAELVVEIEARIIHDFCHGLDWDHCHCKKCSIRAVRVWNWLAGDQDKSPSLWSLAASFVQQGWIERWDEGISSSNPKDAEELIQKVIKGVEPSNLITAFYSLYIMCTKMDIEEQNLCEVGQISTWQNRLQKMVDTLETNTYDILVSNIKEVVGRNEMKSLMQDEDVVWTDILRILLCEIATRKSTNPHTVPLEACQVGTNRVIRDVQW
ncbi:hypothetical protein I314_03616 [Cryptococcus bacillisporus CA1873]|uniref:BTB domain-containing protein n=1 Tax=Cryptococcus bacillisporus CA1873 TaxID=1296111 RepID=A0ABR5B9S2_CRYGA|nr:hypothetical protein I314_03616 [Cryptococcus bacillisporus CA1873]|eukprot:KIR60325.1 hypothetical protein I314_03616 [Cryptococcus gattii CA1873]